MRKYAILSGVATFALTAAALPAQAGQSPFSYQLSSESEAVPAPSEERDADGFLDSALSATVEAFKVVFPARTTKADTIETAKGASDNADNKCDAPKEADDADEEETEEAAKARDKKDVKGKKPSGPEPIYFGF